MRLHKHKELVEAMAKARCRADGFAWGALSSTLQRDYLKSASTALDALLAAVVELGVAEERSEFLEYDDEGPVYTPKLIIQLEKKQP